MSAKIFIKLALPAALLLAIPGLGQANLVDSETLVSGEITPKLFYFNYTGGPGDGLTPYLQSYDSQEAWSGDRENGLFADFDLKLTISDEERNLLMFERQGFGPDNHRTRFSGGNENIGFSSYYTHFRVNTGGVEYLTRPGTVDNPVADIPPYVAAGNAGYMTQFNDDSVDETSYYVERTRYGMGFKFKPDLLGTGTSLALNLDGYKRQGNDFATWVAGNGDITPNSAGQKQARWRGYDKPIDENMGRFSLNFTAAPAGLFQFAYDASHETFNSRARTAMMTDFQTNIEGTIATPTGQTLAGTADLHFVPDSSLMTQSLRVAKTMGNTALAVGYGVTRLEQDSFSNDQVDAGYTTGEINTENAYFNVNHRITSSIGIEGYIKHYNRDNDSTTEPPGGILDRDVRDEWGVRINNIDSLTYGLSATFSGLPVKSTLTAGWKREDTERELQYNYITATSNLGIWPTVSLYSDATESDEFYLKWVARPMQGMTLRLTPSIIQADKTSFVTEAEDSLNLKAALGYAATQQTYFNAYYHLKDKENGNDSFIDTNKPTGGPVVLGPEYEQKADDTFHALGISVNHMPSQWLSLNASIDWAQNDFETYFFGTDRRRFEEVIVFDPRGTSNYKIDTLSLSLNGEYQYSDALALRAGYILSNSEGDLITTSTATAGDYVVNDSIDHTIHTMSLGLGYEMKSNLKLVGVYTYEKYSDKVYSDLDGGYHAVMTGVSLAF